MTTDEYNATDPEFLVSRMIDGDLSDNEQRQLQQALAGSKSLRAEAEKMQAVAALVGRWAGRPPELDWATHAKLIGAGVEGETDDTALGQIDDLLARWGRRSEGIDEETFTAGVMARIRGRRRRASLRRLVLRVGVPLAAAALLAVAVTGRLWVTVPHERTAKVVLGPAAGAWFSPGGGPEPRMVVSFAQTTASSPTAAEEPPGITYITLGASPVAGSWDEGAPL